MNISKINNVTFGKTRYKGLCTTNPNNIYYFTFKDILSLKEESKYILSDQQKRITYVIEKQLFPDRFERKLERDLENKNNTDIIFKYEKDGNITLSLSKSDEKEIKETYKVNNITLKQIKEKTNNFIKDCKDYINSNN